MHNDPPVFPLPYFSKIIYLYILLAKNLKAKQYSSIEATDQSQKRPFL